MRPVLAAAAALAALFLPAIAADAQTSAKSKKLAIVGAEIFDATGAAPFTGTVVISDGVIESVSKGTRGPAGAEVINARGLALLPGLHDVHTHYFSLDRGRYNASEVNYAYVSRGFTTVADFSTGPEAVAAKRDWYAGMAAPHVFFAGRIAPYEAKIWDWGDPATAYWANTPAAAEYAVKDVAAHRFDIIKAFTDGWRYGGPEVAGMDEATLTALVKEAKANNLPVLTHTLTLEHGKQALRAGVSVIVHALQDLPVDNELLGLVSTGSTAYGPSLQTFEPVKPGDIPPPATDPGFQARSARFALALANLQAMHAAGMPLVVGSDSGSSRNPHGPSSQREIELLVLAGLTPSEALIAATANAARVLRQSDGGTIEPGKRADLVLIKGKPWENISDIRNVSRTIMDGKTIYRDGQPIPPLPETPPAIVPASALIADFERADMRTASGALVQIDLDRNGERSWEVLNLTPRAGGGHALSAAARMAPRPDAHAQIVIPFVAGGVQPVDARAFTGVSFETRGAGDYTFAVITPAGAWTKSFAAGDDWAPRTIAFSDLAPPAPDTSWTATDLLAVRVIIARPPGASAWLDLDNIAFD